MKLYDGGIIFLMTMALVGWIAYMNAKDVAKPAVDKYIQEQAQQVPCGLK